MKNHSARKEDLVAAVHAAILAIGIETFKQCSFFGSAHCHIKDKSK